MKYVLLRRENQDVPIIFPEFLTHDAVARAVQSTLPLSRAVPVSAGFCYPYVDATTGESTTLKIVSRPEDARIISAWEYCRGMENPMAERIVEMIREGICRR